MADGEQIDVRVARLEERTTSLEKWRDVLSDDIAETKAMIASLDAKMDVKLAGIDRKLDAAIDTSRRSLPRWADAAIVILVGLLAVAGTMLSTAHWP